MNKFLTTKEAAEYLRAEVSTVRRHCQEGRIRYRKVGRRNLFIIEDLDAFADAGLVEEVA